MVPNQKEIEEKIISSITKSDHLNDLVLSGITKDYFIIHGEVFKFLQKYHSQYKAIPTQQVLKANFNNLEFTDKITDDEREYYTAELIKSDTQRKAIKILNSGADLISSDIHGGIEYLLSNLMKINQPAKKYSISHTDRDALKRLEDFDRRKNAISKGQHLGLKTGFSLFDNQNIGWQPGNFISIIGRLGMGKSWLLEYTACTAYADNHRVLYLSPEMSNEEVELRWDTMMSAFYNYRFPNDDLLIGKIDRNKYKDWLTEISKNNNWITMDSNHGKPFTIEAIEALVDEFQPELLCVDGFLELRSNSSGMDKSWQVMLDIAYGLKAIAQNNKIVVIITSQAKRMNAEDKEQLQGMPGTEQIYGGDALGQASDVIITMTDSDEPNVRCIAVPKVRGRKSYTKRVKLNFDVNIGKIGA